jgi:MoaA/NifB/PqqE/SkfB family radical SAM enzyme
MTLSLQKLFELAYENRQLLYVSMEITHSCNFACKFCYNPVKRSDQKRSAALDCREKPLELNEIKPLLSKLRKSGVLFLTLTGGEPLIHPRFWDILAEANRLSFAVRVFTNGALIDEPAADKLEKDRPYCVEMSIYGASEESYNETNGRGGDFKKVVKAIKLLKERGINLFLKCVLTAVTEKELDRIQDLADELGCELHWDPVLSPSEDGLEYPLSFRASDEGLERLFQNPRFKVGTSPFDRGEGDSVCNIGRISLDIDPFGNIKPCIQWKDPIGNVRKDDILEIWKNSTELKALMEMSKKSLEKIKEETEDHAYCFNCIGRSNLLYGDPTKPDECELKIAKLRRKFSRDHGR